MFCSSQRTGEADGAEEDEEEDGDPDDEEEDEVVVEEGDAEDCRTAKCERNRAAMSSNEEPSDAMP